MYPRLFEIGSVTIYTYGVLLAAAYLAGLKVAMVRARARGLDPARIMDLGILLIISAIVGAKLMLLVVDFRFFWSNPGDLFSLVRSGGVFYGGLILSVAVGLWYVRRHRLPTWTTCDAYAPGIAVGQAIGRVGCLMAGCCYGRHADLPWGITFTSPFAAANVGTPLGVELHPTQIYETIAVLLILAVLLLWERRSVGFAGRTFWSYILLYGIARFVIEIYRGDPRGSVLDAMSTSQFISLLLIPVSVVMLVRLSRRGPAPTPVDAMRRARAA
jgi:phosphatidylglycerol:prolipoprotein diacylglycerol transferase